MEITQNPSFQKASFFSRAIAYLIDQLLVSMTTVFFVSSLNNLGYIEEKNLMYVANIVSFIFLTIYNSAFLYTYGATFGKKWMHMRVIIPSSEKLPFNKILLRESIGKFVSGFPANIGYLYCLIDPQQQTWHDRMVGSYVIALDKEGNPISDTIESDHKPTQKGKLLFGILLFINIIVIIAFMTISSLK
ncbi:MAG: RDD family protein [Candidatus Roizmanbacteria bacterium]